MEKHIASLNAQCFVFRSCGRCLSGFHQCYSGAVSVYDRQYARCRWMRAASLSLPSFSLYELSLTYCSVPWISEAEASHTGAALLSDEVPELLTAWWGVYIVLQTIVFELFKRKHVRPRWNTVESLTFSPSTAIRMMRNEWNATKANSWIAIICYRYSCAPPQNKYCKNTDFPVSSTIRFQLFCTLIYDQVPAKQNDNDFWVIILSNYDKMQLYVILTMKM